MLARSRTLIFLIQILDGSRFLEGGHGKMRGITASVDGAYQQDAYATLRSKGGKSPDTVVDRLLVRPGAPGIRIRRKNWR